MQTCGLAATFPDSDAATSEVSEDMLGFDVVLHKNKVWLTAGVPLVYGNRRLAFRGYVREKMMAHAAVWEALHPEDQAAAIAKAIKERGDSLRSAVHAGRNAALVFLKTCDAEGLKPNLDKFIEVWQKGVTNLLYIQESLDMTLASLRADAARENFIARISAEVSLSDYPEMFPAINRKRKIIAVLGPTNSGKTYEAFQRLATAESGVYLGPLRLLALEAYTRLNEEFGTTASLITGEERRIVEGSKITASTIEMLDPSQELEVAVIDEGQMLKDPQRGWAWTQAIVGVNAKEIWVLGALSAEPAIVSLAERLNLPLEIRKKVRKNGLAVTRKPLAAQASDAIQNAEDGDAFIVFSRRDALNLRDDLMQQGRSVACIYGALSPEVREREALRFASGAAEMLVATDAIGMGLNLPIRRIIFTSVTKYNGHEREEVPKALLQQIGGRAGRFGYGDEEGLVIGLTPAEHQVVRARMHEAQDDLDIQGFHIGPSASYLEKISQMTGETKLELLLSLFISHANRGDGFFTPYVPTEQLDRAHVLDKLPMALSLKYIFGLIPLPTKHPVLDATWLEWAKLVSQNKRIALKISGHPTTALLEDAEVMVQMLAAYRWCAHRLPDVFVDKEEAETVILDWVEAVDAHLRSRRKQGCGGGKKGQPSWYWAPQ